MKVVCPSVLFCILAAEDTRLLKSALVGTPFSWGNYYSKIDRLVNGVLVPQEPSKAPKALLPPKESSGEEEQTNGPGPNATASLESNTKLALKTASPFTEQQNVNDKAAALLAQSKTSRWGHLLANREPLSTVLGFRELWGAPLPGSRQLHSLHDEDNINVEGPFPDSPRTPADLAPIKLHASARRNETSTTSVPPTEPSQCGR